MNINLFAFPFAGGSVYSYAKYKNIAPFNINFIPLELPGRGKRIVEPLLTDIHAMADDLYKLIRHQLTRPYAFYGHSMGTLLAYLITRRIINDGLNLPLCLFMTGRFGPSAEDPDPPDHALPTAEFRQKIRDMGGSPDELLQDENIMDFFEPILRADFQAIEEYVYQPAEPFNIPITVMIGRDEKISEEQAMAWQMETTRPVNLRWFNGRHFFIFDHPVEIMKIISNKLKVLMQGNDQY